ncbi:MAG: GntR family transcriptional regulator [Actinomycetota bacterium]
MTVTVAIDVNSPTPPYEQLRQQLGGQIRAGRLQPGDRLPTVRQLSSDLGLAKNTVVRAYRALEGDGLVSGQRRRGTIVSERRRPRTERDELISEAAQRFADDLNTHGATIDEALSAVQAAFAKLDADTTSAAPARPPA